MHSFQIQKNYKPSNITTKGEPIMKIKHIQRSLYRKFTGICLGFILFSLLSAGYCFSQTITCPGNQVRYTDPGVCSYTAQGGECDPTSYTPAGGTLSNNITGNNSSLANYIFPLGPTLIIWTVDGSASCSFTITVVDAELPNIICPSNQVKNTSPGCGYIASGT